MTFNGVMALIMAALRSRCGHYIFILWFLLLSSSFCFFPRLISAVTDWMPTISPHMMWPQCEFTAATSLTGGQPNFERCLAVSRAATLFIHFWGLLPPNGILPGAKITLRPSLAFYIGSVSTRHWSSGRQPNFVAWYKEWHYGTFADGTTCIRLGGHHVGHQLTFPFDFMLRYRPRVTVYLHCTWTFVTQCLEMPHIDINA